jgi:hypothetical protein
MAMSDTEMNDFINVYTKALVTSWSSEEYTQRLTDSPRNALAEVGLELPANARISIIKTIPEESDPTAARGHLDRQVALWQVGLDTGYYELYIPSTPQVDAENLDLNELQAVAGGDVNCCCCPCSCCT